MSPSFETPLSRREREILDIVYRLGETPAARIRDEMDAPPSYSAVRGLLRILEEKGHLKHRREGIRNLYTPTSPPDNAGRSALKRVLDTFFGGDPAPAMAALLDVSDRQLSDDELARLQDLVSGDDDRTPPTPSEGEPR